MANIPKYLLPKKNLLGRKPINPRPRSCPTGSRRNNSNAQPQKKDTVSGDDDGHGVANNLQIIWHPVDTPDIDERLFRVFSILFKDGDLYEEPKKVL